MENPSLHTEPRKFYPIDFKLTLVEMATQPNACVAKIAREHGINDNVLFKWIRLWQKEGRVSRRLPRTRTVQTSPVLLPVELVKETSAMTEVKPLMQPPAALSTTASSCCIEFRHGKMTLDNPSPELLAALICELSGRTMK